MPSIESNCRENILTVTNYATHAYSFQKVVHGLKMAVNINQYIYTVYSITVYLRLDTRRKEKLVRRQAKGVVV